MNDLIFFFKLDLAKNQSESNGCFKQGLTIVDRHLCRIWSLMLWGWRVIQLKCLSPAAESIKNSLGITTQIVQASCSPPLINCRPLVSPKNFWASPRWLTCVQVGPSYLLPPLPTGPWLRFFHLAWAGQHALSPPLIYCHHTAED
jgi:hypothetical protein